MKTTILLLFILILFSSCYTTHVSTMLNEPAFEKAGQVQASGTVALDHIEGQAAVSITNHIGILGGTYRAFKGINIYDLGINFYTRAAKNSKNYIAFTVGGTEGTHKGGNGYFIPLSHGKWATIHNEYNSKYIQLSYIVNNSNSDRNDKTIFLLKYEWINFFKYDVKVSEATGSSRTSYTIRQTAENRNAVLYRPTVLHHIQKAKSKWFWQVQYGLNIVNGFRINEVERVSGSLNDINQYERMNHAKVFPLFLNVTLGLKFKL